MEEIIKAFTDSGVSRELAIFYIIVSALLVVMAIVALVMRIMVVLKYFQGNRQTTKCGKNNFQIVEELLAKENLSHVKVAKAGILRALFFGNSYSLSKKTIFLRGTIANKNTITAVGIAVQKVGIAKLCESGNKITKTRNIMQVLNIFAPILFVPVVLLGFLADIIVFNTVGTFSIVGIVIGLVLVLSGLIATLLNLPVEKKANKMAYEMIKESHILDDEEMQVIKKVFDAYIIAYVCEFIVAVLRVIQIILEIIIKSQMKK